jgi:hypothetical protein
MSSMYELTKTTGDLVTDQAITAGATYTYSGDTTVKLLRPEYVLIIMEATAAGATTSLVDFNWIARNDESDPWPTTTTFTTQLTLNGTTPVIQAVQQLVKAYAEVKLFSIKNNAASNASGVNCRISFKV